jgi:cytochrome c oxidase subunit 3
MPPTVPVADHFATFDEQEQASRMGMWIFIATEILLFTGLFVLYTCYRFVFPDTFRLASSHMEVGLGTANTLVLITSSLTVALSLYFIEVGRPRVTFACLMISLFFGLCFMGIKGVEYWRHFEEGSLWGSLYHLNEVPAAGASLFFTLYFAMTGLHALHVLAGMIVLTWLAGLTLRGRFNPTYHTPLELGGMYWHLVDLIWIFLYPLLYLVA